jgi:hypothetical protein
MHLNNHVVEEMNDLFHVKPWLSLMNVVHHQIRLLIHVLADRLYAADIGWNLVLDEHYHAE